MKVCIQPSNHWEVEKIICAFCQAMAQYCHPSLFTNLFCVMTSLNASCTTYCMYFTYVPTHLARYLLVYQAPSLLYIIITYIQYLFVYLDTLFVLPTYFTTDQTKYLPKTCTNNCPQYSLFTLLYVWESESCKNNGIGTCLLSAYIPTASTVYFRYHQSSERKQSNRPEVIGSNLPPWQQGQ